MFILGFFLDTFEIILIVVPITAPAILALDVDPIWLGVMIGVNLQTSFLTPPVGFALFYLRGVAPPEITTGHIYRGIVPFVAMQIVAMALVWIMPSTATWLPEVIFKTPPAMARDDKPAAPALPSDDGALDRDPTDDAMPSEPAPGGSVIDQLLREKDPLSSAPDPL
jgi:hypothetical protein